MWVDVGATLERKIEALFCHASQLVETGDWFRDFLRESAIDAGPGRGRAVRGGVPPDRARPERAGPGCELDARARGAWPRHSDWARSTRIAIVAAPIAATIVPTERGAELLQRARRHVRLEAADLLQQLLGPRRRVGTRRRDQAVADQAAQRARERDGRRTSLRARRGGADWDAPA